MHLLVLRIRSRLCTCHPPSRHNPRRPLEGGTKHTQPLVAAVNLTLGNQHPLQTDHNEACARAQQCAYLVPALHGAGWHRRLPPAVPSEDGVQPRRQLRGESMPLCGCDQPFRLHRHGSTQSTTTQSGLNFSNRSRGSAEFTGRWHLQDSRISEGSSHTKAHLAGVQRLGDGAGHAGEGRAVQPAQHERRAAEAHLQLRRWLQPRLPVHLRMMHLRFWIDAATAADFPCS